MTSEQIPLIFPHNPSMRTEDFVVTSSNAEAYAHLITDSTNWIELPLRSLVLYGPEGCGKTHLAHIFLAQNHGRLIIRDELHRIRPETLTEQTKFLALDNIDAVAGNANDERALFHLYQHIKAISGALLLTSRHEPAEWTFNLPDLLTRLRSSTPTAIHTPDDELLSALFRKQFSDRQLRVEEKVITYLVRRMERSARKVFDLAETLDRESAKTQTPITIPFVQEFVAA